MPTIGAWYLHEGSKLPPKAHKAKLRGCMTNGIWAKAQDRGAVDVLVDPPTPGQSDVSLVYVREKANNPHQPVGEWEGRRDGAALSLTDEGCLIQKAPEQKDCTRGAQSETRVSRMSQPTDRGGGA